MTLDYTKPLVLLQYAQGQTMKFLRHFSMLGVLIFLASLALMGADLNKQNNNTIKGQIKVLIKRFKSNKPDQNISHISQLPKVVIPESNYMILSRPRKLEAIFERAYRNVFTNKS